MTDRFGSVHHHTAARHLYFRVMAHQKCDDACYDRTRRQQHKAERCFAGRILDPADAYGPTKPPRLPIELINAMPPAAAAPVRKLVGRVQKVALAAYSAIALMVRATAARTALSI